MAKWMLVNEFGDRIEREFKERVKNKPTFTYYGNIQGQDRHPLSKWLAGNLNKVKKEINEYRGQKTIWRLNG